MKNYSYFGFLIVSLFLQMSCSKTLPSSIEPDVVLVTEAGEIGLKLYKETPIHRENFLKLAQEGFYDSLLFHRVIHEFMIQAGDPRTRNEQTQKDTTLGDDPGYTLPAEIRESFLHTPGKLAAARYPDNENPEWRSSGSQFYIVTGAPVNAARLDTMEMQYNYIRKGRYFTEWQAAVNKGDYTDAFDAYLKEKGFSEYHYSMPQRKIYYEEGGAPWLDFQYTIFGEVVKGMDVANEIGKVSTNQYDQPLKPIRILKMIVPDTLSAYTD
ncbi:MAG: peptidylprolyl isomerase [Bacteroidia bacterium]|nr:peptidylprolyl isomerase [Bacteroidia bacterium]